MKDAMTDHKAHVRCLQDFAAAYDADSENGRAFRAAIAALTAAPAASEGEDGAVLWISPEDFRNPHFVGINAVRAGHEQHGKHYTMPLYTRPAAQVAVTPKHDEGREASLAIRTLARDIHHAIADDGYAPQSPADYNGMRESIIRALATQPAARRVTDEALCDALKAYNRAANRWHKLDLDSRDEPRSLVAMRAALESFAQPAEGVSGG